MGLSDEQMRLMRQLKSGVNRAIRSKPLLAESNQFTINNPAGVADALGAYTPEFNRMAGMAFGLNQELFNQQLAAYNRGEGGFPGAIGYQLTPDVFYKRQMKTDRNRKAGKAVEFVSFKNTPMLDWDTPDPRYHPDSSVTVRNLGDVEEVIREYQKVDPTSAMRLYQTPGGYRAFELGRTGNPISDQQLYKGLKVDPNYVQFNMRSDDLGPGMLESPGFRSRISDKPGRSGDFVAQPIAMFKGEQAMINPRSRAVIQEVHDRPIQQKYRQGGPATKEAIEQIEAAMPTASKSLQLEIRRRLRL